MKKIQKQKSKPKINPRPKRKKFLAHHLGIILAVFLLLEGVLVTQTHAPDWQAGLSVLSMPDLFDQPAADLADALVPELVAFDQVANLFLQMTDALESLLDINHGFDDVSYIWLGVSNFYQQSADELGTLLGMPQLSLKQPMISGAIISH